MATNHNESPAPVCPNGCISPGDDAPIMHPAGESLVRCKGSKHCLKGKGWFPMIHFIPSIADQVGLVRG